MEARVITFTLCAAHDLYYQHACPSCFLEDAQRREGYTGQPLAMADVAYLASTSTPWPLY